MPSRQELVNLVNAAADRYGIDRTIAYNQINQESGFNPNARSSAGALGLAQFIPATARQYGINPLDPAQAADGWGRYMRKSLDAFEGRYDLALASYNWGSNHAALRLALRTGAPPLGLPQETANYVAKILGKSGDYSRAAATAAASPLGISSLGLILIGAIVLISLGD